MSDTTRKMSLTLRSAEWWQTWIGIFAGCAVMATGFVIFINPYNIVPGGVYGASIVLHNLFPSIQVGTFGYMFDIPLLILSVLLLGSRLGSRTIVAALLTPLLMNTMSACLYPTQEALESLDPALLMGGALDMSHHLMLTAIVGGVLIGVGCGTVVRNHGTTGGSDIVAMMMHKYLHTRFSNALLIVDGVVVLFGLVVIGFLHSPDSAASSTPSWHLSLYSLICIFVTSKVVSRTINGAKDDKLIFVISSQKLAGFHQFILHDLNRTATCIKSSGLYSGEEKEMLFIVVSYKEVARVKGQIKATDPNAFVIVTDAYDAFGEGWKPLPNPSDIEPE